MKLICAPETRAFDDDGEALNVVLFGNSDRPERGDIGALVKQRILREKLSPAARAWDLLSLALSVFAADLSGHRDRSPDGWSREFELDVAVGEPEFWASVGREIQDALAFLTTDRWRLTFAGEGFRPDAPPDAATLDQDSVVLLSGGLDSLVGATDLVSNGRRPFAVSQLVRGDADNQEAFARELGLRHLLLNHNAQLPDSQDAPSQRARSLVFLAYGVLAATTLASYHAGEEIALYICENGFIAINPPLTGARLGALSTRTAHPVFLAQVQRLLEACGLRVRLENPYRLTTKGEMLLRCADQERLRKLASTSTSCARYLRYGYRHCGRCMPCQIRRASFLAWGVDDATTYVFQDLGKDDEEHAGFDDVRSVAMAIAEVQAEGLDSWLGSSLSTALLGDVGGLKAVAGRGLGELAALHKKYNVK
jgi:7-cyano-7-deazaguanine synthase in queuosine biosynthesis